MTSVVGVGSKVCDLVAHPFEFAAMLIHRRYTLLKLADEVRFDHDEVRHPIVDLRLRILDCPSFHRGHPTGSRVGGSGLFTGRFVSTQAKE